MWDMYIRFVDCQRVVDRLSHIPCPGTKSITLEPAVSRKRVEPFVPARKKKEDVCFLMVVVVCCCCGWCCCCCCCGRRRCCCFLVHKIGRWLATQILTRSLWTAHRPEPSAGPGGREIRSAAVMGSFLGVLIGSSGHWVVSGRAGGLLQNPQDVMRRVCVQWVFAPESTVLTPLSAFWKDDLVINPRVGASTHRPQCIFSFGRFESRFLLNRCNI